MSHITDFHVGYEFIPVRFQLNAEEVALYLQAVGESNALFRQQKLVPLTALAAYGLRGILIEIGLPPGAIHSAQETSVSRAITSDETIVFSAKLTQNAVWKGWRFVTVDYTGVDESEKQVLYGRSTVVIPEEQRGDTGQ
ncbi:MAG: MaoC family dehydratase N-terminal domain-containing protein [Chloroflexi bacterium]|nr:MaoC family dehydratase N-terminal domain-containing protein [Chloroflexota bacterium]